MITTFFNTIIKGELDKIDDFRPGTWINVENATLEDLEQIGELTNLDLPDIDDSLDVYESPRFERIDNSVIIFVRYPKELDNGLFTDILTIILTPKHFITISPGECPMVHKLYSPRIPFATTQRSRMLIKLLLLITRSFNYHIKQVRHTVLAQKRNLESITGEDILQLAEGEEILNQYVSALVPMQNVIQNIISGHYVEMYANDEELLEDLLISFRQSTDICSVNLKSIRSVRDSYQIVFNNNLNRIIKFLTTFTIVLTIPTMISSFYGINVALPFDHHPQAYLIILGISVAASGGLFIFFWKKKWF